MSDALPSLASLARALRGPHSFLIPEAEEIYRLMPDLLQVIPMPQRIYLADETVTPIVGYPVLGSPEMKALREALTGYLKAEEEAQVQQVETSAVDAPTLQAAWKRYRVLLTRATEN